MEDVFKEKEMGNMNSNVLFCGFSLCDNSNLLIPKHNPNNFIKRKKEKDLGMELYVKEKNIQIKSYGYG